MEGPLADRELSVAKPEVVNRLRFALATQRDDEAIRRLLRENPTPGEVSLSFEREPNYFAGSGLAGARDHTVVAYSGDQLVCLGHCATRNGWVGDEVKKVGYLGELRLDAAARGRFGIIRRGYEFFRDLQQADPADVYFTSIGSDNTRARRLLESGLRGLPTYTFLSELVTLLIPVHGGAKVRLPAKVRAIPATPDRLDDMIEFLNTKGVRQTLGTAWTKAQWLNLERHGLTLGDVHWLVRDEKIVGCGALWDQRGFKQTVVRGYAPALGRSRPLLNLVAPLLGTPRLPSPGTELAHAFLSPLATDAGSDGLLAGLISSFLPRAAERGLEFVIVGMAGNDPRLPALQKRFKNRVYRTRLYEVHWPGQSASGGETRISRVTPILPDMGLL